MTDAPPGKNAAKDLLEWLGLSASPNWAKARTLGGSIGVILTLFFVAAFVAAASVLYGTPFAMSSARIPLAPTLAQVH